MRKGPSPSRRRRSKRGCRWPKGHARSSQGLGLPEAEGGGISSWGQRQCVESILQCSARKSSNKGDCKSSRGGGDDDVVIILICLFFCYRHGIQSSSSSSQWRESDSRF
ncbi:hypothetical protein MRB53_007389 [Persea americana]|uniref:Uncharacterized protein n=1 Tax=Persea americana TaxID=3435 RepID=A0ACC2MIP6_PERAE|nr:hypothetical protein MRB53_007389 [Persea americana]